MIFNYSAKPVFYVFFDDHINFNFQLFFALWARASFCTIFLLHIFSLLSIRQVWWIANNEWRGNELRWRNFKKLNRNKKNDSSLSKNIFCHLSCRLSVSMLTRHDEKWSNIYQKKLKLTYWWRRLKSKHIFHTQKNARIGNGNEWMGNRVDSRLSWRRKKNENNFTLLMSQAVENSRSMVHVHSNDSICVYMVQWAWGFEARGRSTHATILMSMKYVHYAVHDRFNKTFKHFHSLSRCNLEFIKFWCTLPSHLGMWFSIYSPLELLSTVVWTSIST